MSSRKPFIAANWKMHSHPEELKSYLPTNKVDTAVFCTPFDMKECLDAGLVTGGQYGHPLNTGARTGDISMAMIAQAGCTHVLCGHSERRQHHGETNAFVAEQVAAAITHNLHPILCIGETEKEKDAGKGKDVVKEQLEIGLASSGDAKITIAYEPVWAISGGDPNKPAATPESAEEMHAYIRSLLPEKRRDSIRILYGGSMKPENAKDLLAQKNIDGGLVGGASLHPEKFQAIMEIAALA